MNIQANMDVLQCWVQLTCLGDQYIDREENNKIKDVIFHFLTANDFKLNQIDADDPEV